MTEYLSWEAVLVIFGLLALATGLVFWWQEHGRKEVLVIVVHGAKSSDRTTRSLPKGNLAAAKKEAKKLVGTPNVTRVMIWSQGADRMKSRPLWQS